MYNPGKSKDYTRLLLVSWCCLDFYAGEKVFNWIISLPFSLVVFTKLRKDSYSSEYLVMSHFRTCKYSNVETNLFLCCPVSGLLDYEHPSVILFYLSVTYDRYRLCHSNNASDKSTCMSSHFNHKCLLDNAPRHLTTGNFRSKYILLLGASIWSNLRAVTWGDSNA